MRVQPRTWSLLVVMLVAISSAVSAQQTLKLGDVIAVFLTDSGSRRSPLPWTAGSALPITWESDAPVESDAEGYTLGLSGKARVAIQGRAAVPISIQLLGNNAGIERVTLGFDWKNPDIDVVEKTIAADGVQLMRLRCDRKTEPKAAGNVLFEARAPGKVPVGLAEAWSCGDGAGCTLGLSILYDRADVNSIRCMAAA